MKIQYFASQIFVINFFFFENFNIFRNNIISVEVAKLVKVTNSLLPCFLLAKFRQKEKYFFFLKNGVILEGFHRQKWENKNIENRQISIFGFQCVATNIEAWLEILYSHILFIARFG